MPLFTQTLNASIEIEVEADDAYAADELIRYMSTADIMKNKVHMGIHVYTEELPQEI